MNQHDDIKNQIGIHDLRIRLSDSGHFIWANITRDGKSWSHRLPLDPQQHHIEAAKEAASQWWKDEQE